MGLDVNGTKFLLYAKKLGVSFVRTATIGRQEMLVNEADLSENLRRFFVETTAGATAHLIDGPDKYAERFLKLLGADEVVSFDASSYENASVVHDFNHPIPDEYKNRFETVLDGGTLEHIFNYPTAIKNCMEMVAEGGHFLAITPANNQLGHGFYQFSPELFFRIFSKQNGFEIQKVMIFEETPGCEWYEVVDPDAVRERVWLVNTQRAMLLVIAQKVKTVDIFATMPQQSDYVAIWEGKDGGGGAETPRFAGLPFRNIVRMPLTAIRRIRINLDRSRGMLNRKSKHFKKVDLP